MWSFLIAAMALIGTAMQAVAASGDLARQETESFRAHQAVEQLRHEIAWWHLRARYARRSDLKGLLNESAAEYAAWRSVERRLWSWALLMTAAFFNLLFVVV
ncbi:hypothetical protein [Cellulomonas edaphi]|uniref:Uncharacterized protein n=1 Tax=Cellulomonas edaphi TaxID=3053468 RepID=A0ABT7S7N9_9CELL|nr:hypothetical protein [Cellulomons edaphi]MDM7831646.1 hypothetical protein [Cellulomons edaphi]